MPVYPGASIHQQRDHHRRIVRRAPVTIRAIRVVERVQIQLLDRRQNEPRKVILRQPVTQAQRHQQDLLTLARQEVLGHHPIVFKAAGRPALRDSHHGKEQRE
jgi:hypothetical protein